VILLYHRVAELPTDPQLLAVTPRHFAEQLEIIGRLGEPTRLTELEERLRRPIHSKPLIAVTFDDGYADNLHEAKPLLARYGIPATVFVSSGHVRSQKEFIHDELEKIFLEPRRLPPTLCLTLDGRRQRWELGRASEYDDGDYRVHRNWNALSGTTPTARHQVYRSLCETLCAAAAEWRSAGVRQLLRWSQASPEARPSHRPLSPAELVQLHQGGLVDIGGHTVDHLMLSRLSSAAQQSQIAEGKAALEMMLGSPVATFAYPYGARGHYSAASVAAVRAAGFARACSNFAGLVRRGADQWQLPRLIVRDWPAPVFEHQMRTWLWQLA
jgi:peptidoglycan/xylan/chitin deacetylase (PgdA/CDA1 family)